MSQPPSWAELLQLVPVISLALPIILSGDVDLPSMSLAFTVATGLAMLITGGLAHRGVTLNPVLLGTALWLGLGAVGFGLPVAALASWLAETQAFGLFACALGVGLIATLRGGAGYIGAAHEDPSWVRSRSLALLGVTALAVGWAWVFRHDVRLGGGLPFIVVNVTRRVLIARS